MIILVVRYKFEALAAVVVVPLLIFAILDDY